MASSPPPIGRLFPLTDQSRAMVHTEGDCMQAFPESTGRPVSNAAGAADQNFDSVDFLRHALCFGMRQYDAITEGAKAGYDDADNPLDMYALMLLPWNQKGSNRLRVRILSFQFSDSSEAGMAAAMKAAGQVLVNEARRTKAVAFAVISETWLQQDLPPDLLRKLAGKMPDGSTPKGRDALDPQSKERLKDFGYDALPTDEALSFTYFAPQSLMRPLRFIAPIFKGRKIRVFFEQPMDPRHEVGDPIFIALHSYCSAENRNFKYFARCDGELARHVAVVDDDIKALKSHGMPAGLKQEYEQLVERITAVDPNAKRIFEGSSSDEEDRQVKERVRKHNRAEREGHSSQAESFLASGFSFPSTVKQEEKAYSRLGSVVAQYTNSPGKKRLDSTKTKMRSLIDQACMKAGAESKDHVKRLLLETDLDGWTVLHQACYTREYELVEFLLALVVLKEGRGHSSMAESGNTFDLECVHDRRALGEILNAQEHTRAHTALHLAALGADRSPTATGASSSCSIKSLHQLFQYLLGLGATVLRNKDGYSALDYVQSERLPKAKEMLADERAACVRVLTEGYFTKMESQCANPSCSQAAVANRKLARCTRCKLVCYCDRNCQAAHWAAKDVGHKIACVKAGQLPATLEMSLNARTGAVRFF
eukprot:TRINITY_DN41994_c0_g1_i1.p1 TRINITY_DN41994_c0_g1~~TRINITY_DN41994_c0_g1_i1.p1  ORF type:complete len:651 (-),score=129.77 TRINITY_DN41994_c0_g1_i1:236-2188(-)